MEQKQQANAILESKKRERIIPQKQKPKPTCYLNELILAIPGPYPLWSEKNAMVLFLFSKDGWVTDGAKPPTNKSAEEEKELFNLLGGPQLFNNKIICTKMSTINDNLIIIKGAREDIRQSIVGITASHRSTDASKWNTLLFDCDQKTSKRKNDFVTVIYMEKYNEKCIGHKIWERYTQEYESNIAPKRGEIEIEQGLGIYNRAAWWKPLLPDDNAVDANNATENVPLFLIELNSKIVDLFFKAN